MEATEFLELGQQLLDSLTDAAIPPIGLQGLVSRRQELTMGLGGAAIDRRLATEILNQNAAIVEKARQRREELQRRLAGVERQSQHLVTAQAPSLYFDRKC